MYSKTTAINTHNLGGKSHINKIRVQLLLLSMTEHSDVPAEECSVIDNTDNCILILLKTRAVYHCSLM